MSELEPPSQEFIDSIERHRAASLKSLMELANAPLPHWVIGSDRKRCPMCGGRVITGSEITERVNAVTAFKFETKKPSRIGTILRRLIGAFRSTTHNRKQP